MAEFALPANTLPAFVDAKRQQVMCRREACDSAANPVAD
jgi:hypothetical protein